MDKPEIIALRASLGVTQQKMAQALGISICSLNKWENGRNVPAGLGAVLLPLVKEALQRGVPPENLVNELLTAQSSLDRIKYLCRAGDPRNVKNTIGSTDPRAAHPHQGR